MGTPRFVPQNRDISIENGHYVSFWWHYIFESEIRKTSKTLGFRVFMHQKASLTVENELCTVAIFTWFTPARGQNQQPKESVMVSDAQFGEMAVQINLLEITLGRHATSKAKRTEVQEFGQQMVKDHSEAQRKLEQILTKKNTSTAFQLDRKHQMMAEKLTAKSGDEFDHAYIQEMVKGHQKAADLMEYQSNHGKDTELKAYAKETLPSVKMHLEHAKAIWKKSLQSTNR